MTIPTQRVLQVLLDELEREFYGYELGQLAGLRTGTIHPILARLEGIGWVTSHWEDVDPQAAGRPARRYYRMTAEGVQAARAALARAYRPAAVRRLSLVGGAT